MGRLSFWPAVLGFALAMILVTLIEPVRHSMAYAAGAVVIIGLIVSTVIGVSVGVAMGLRQSVEWAAAPIFIVLRLQPCRMRPLGLPISMAQLVTFFVFSSVTSI